jgi:hypothetical protein
VLFSDAFWDGMFEGRSVWGSFLVGQEAVRNVGYGDCQEEDLLCQEPWLDDNGNSVPNEPEDGSLAQERGLIAAFGWSVPEIAWVRVSPTGEEGEAAIEAEVRDDGSLDVVEAMIIPPEHEPADPGDGSLPAWNVPTVTLALSGTTTYAGRYADFTAAGEYRVVVHAKDADGHTAVPKSAVIEGMPSAVPPQVTKFVRPEGEVEYGDWLTYTLVVSATPGTPTRLYDPLTGTTFSRFLAQPEGVSHEDGAITGTLTVTPTSQVTVSFVAQVEFPGTLGWTGTITNRACVYPFAGTLGGCFWSNEVVNPAFRPYEVYLPLVVRE